MVTGRRGARHLLRGGVDHGRGGRTRVEGRRVLCRFDYLKGPRSLEAADRPEPKAVKPADLGQVCASVTPTPDCYAAVPKVTACPERFEDVPEGELCPRDHDRAALPLPGAALRVRAHRVLRRRLPRDASLPRPPSAPPSRTATSSETLRQHWLDDAPGACRSRFEPSPPCRLQLVMTRPESTPSRLRSISLRTFGLGLALPLGARLLACASESPPRSSPPGAFDAGHVIHGGPADAGGGDGGTTAALDPTAACIEYMRGYCERSVRCFDYGLSFEQCMDSARFCPDVMFAPGSTRSVEGVRACADDWRELGCDAELGRPGCATPGTRALGEPCIASMQCASLVCSAFGDSCGICARVVGVDDPCHDAAGLYCPDDFYCVEARCTPSSNLRPARLGDECDPRSPRCGRHECRADSDEVYRCQPYPARGESCSESGRCAFEDSYCAVGQVCAAFPAVGESCGVDGFTGQAVWCGPGTYCSGVAPEPRISTVPVSVPHRAESRA